MEIGSVKGRRHRVGLPVRGQRTRTNARTTTWIKENCSRKEKIGFKLFNLILINY